MTLVFASAQQDVQFVVADRRISILPTGETVDDWAHKILQYWNRQQAYEFLVGYTGAARLGRQTTLEWLTESLPTVFDQSTDIQHAIDAFPAACERQLAPITWLSLTQKALTILLCGRYNRFGPDLRNPDYIPFAAVISNCADERGRQTSQVTHAFRAYSKRLLRPTQPPITLRYGDMRAALPHADDFKQAYRLMRKPLSHKAKVEIAVRHIRRVAEGSNTVGKNVLGAALLGPGTSEAFDFPEDTDVAIKSMPDVISPDGPLFTDFKVIPIATDEP